MADDKKKTGHADPSKVAAGEKYAVARAAKKAGAKPAEFPAAIKKVGNLRTKIEDALKKKKLHVIGSSSRPSP